MVILFRGDTSARDDGRFSNDLSCFFISCVGPASMPIFIALILMGQPCYLVSTERTVPMVIINVMGWMGDSTNPRER